MRDSLGTAAREIALAEELGQPADAARNRATSSLGGVRSEYGMESHGLEALGRGIRSDLFAELGERACRWKQTDR